MQNLLFLLPPEWMILAIAAIALAVMLRLIKPGAVLLILSLSLLAAAGPLLDTLFSLLPSWVLFLLFLGSAIGLFRWAASLLIGEDAAGHMVGSLAADAVRGAFRLLFLPFRLLGWILFRKSS